LTTYLFRSFGVDQDRVALNMNIDTVPVSIETAVPCGLMVNELVSNSLKYAFDGGIGSASGQEIGISLARGTNDDLILTVSDNGKGFPADLDFRRTESLGLQLVSTLVEQLSGAIELDRSHGTKFSIRFSQGGGTKSGGG
jgi:two-component sensor histidine kinase